MFLKEHRLDIVPQQADLVGHLDAMSRDGWELLTMAPVQAMTSRLAHGQRMPAWALVFARPFRGSGKDNEQPIQGDEPMVLSPAEGIS